MKVTAMTRLSGMPRALLLGAVFLGVGVVPVTAQLQVSETGTVGAGLLLRQLDGAKRVLMIGAHPDDEDSSLLAALSRGYGAETAYLALNRGEGGQNLIGPEFHDGLGIVRTGELLAARSIDGGRQFFTRAYDFGFSKSDEETFGYWSREELLHDVVWVIRTYRPHVIVSVFTGTPRDGHGQHQVAGQLAHEAFDIAADPNRFPEQLTRGAVPWQPSKLYLSRRFSPDQATSSVSTGTFDPLLGRSYHQLAMDSRSQHRSQDMGAAQSPGPRTSSLSMVKSAGAGAEEGDGPFAGVDTALVAWVDELPANLRAPVTESLEAYRVALHEAEASLEAIDPSTALAPLTRAVTALEAARARLASDAPDSELRRVLDRKSELAHRAVMAAGSIALDVRVDDDLVVPGEEVEVLVQLWNGGRATLTELRPTLSMPDGWTATPVEDAEGTGTLDPGTIARWRFRVAVPENADLSRLYYRADPRTGGTYNWPDRPELWAQPKDPPPVTASVAFDLSYEGTTTPIHRDRIVEYVGVEQAFGEYREPLLIVPAISVALEPTVIAWPSGDSEARSVSVHLRNQVGEGSSGVVRLDLPEGWTSAPAEASFTFSGPDTEESVHFEVTPTGGAREGMHIIRAVAEVEGYGSYAEGFDLIDYPHIERTARFDPAETVVSVFPVTIAENLSVGYIMGTGDDGPTALRQMGFRVEELSPDQVRSGAFDAYDVIVLGVRVYESRPDLIAANDRLLAFARDGGTVISQYNQYSYPAGGFAPYEVGISRPHDRVTDENAEVTLLHEDAPVFTGPNSITEQDFRGWIQERGLYFLGEWDDAFVPLMEMSDPGEDPKQGALLVSEVGDGLYVYTGIAFFRQFPRGVPGAFRLFANLVSLRPEEWRQWAAGVVFE